MSELLFDVHTHVLPNVDDGSDSVSTSLDMIRTLRDQGVGRIYATPHYLPEKESVDAFIARRNKAKETLLSCPELANDGMPELRMGAEVHLCRGFSDVDLSALCYEDSRAILLELPREPLSRQILKEIRIACDSALLIPVFAHIDRYTWFSASDIDSLSEIPDAVFSFNSACLTSFSSKRLLKKLSREHYVLFGSDSHNTDTRSPDFYRLTGIGGKRALSKKGAEEYIRMHVDSCEHIFGKSTGEDWGIFF